MFKIKSNNTLRVNNELCVSCVMFSYVLIIVSTSLLAVLYCVKEKLEDVGYPAGMVISWFQVLW